MNNSFDNSTNATSLGYGARGKPSPGEANTMLDRESLNRESSSFLDVNQYLSHLSI